VPGAAFFDLDRTLIARSSSLALAEPFHRRGLIGWRQLAKARLAQDLFIRFGAGHGRAGQTADAAMSILKGLRVEVLQEIVEGAWKPVLRPLVYREALSAAEEHGERGEPVFIVSGALQEVVDRFALELGFAGALGSRAGVEDGVYTGRLDRRVLGAEKAVALRELARARDISLETSTAYSDSHSDIAFLESVGTPVAVNPDRELRRIAEDRGWKVTRFRDRLGHA
jgi:HAD superfamily hydrolase (TIGR01490 family)